MDPFHGQIRVDEPPRKEQPKGQEYIRMRIVVPPMVSDTSSFVLVSSLLLISASGCYWILTRREWTAASLPGMGGQLLVPGKDGEWRR